MGIRMFLSLLYVLSEKLYETLKTVFGHSSKYPDIFLIGGLLLMKQLQHLAC